MRGLTLKPELPWGRIEQVVSRTDSELGTVSYTRSLPCGLHWSRPQPRPTDPAY